MAIISKHYANLSEVSKADWNSRLPSTVHALIAVFVCYYPALFSNQDLESTVFHDEADLFVQYGSNIGPEFSMALSVFYLLVDFTLVLPHWK